VLQFRTFLTVTPATGALKQEARRSVCSGTIALTIHSKRWLIPFYSIVLPGPGV